MNSVTHRTFIYFNFIDNVLTNINALAQLQKHNVVVMLMTAKIAMAMMMMIIMIMIII